MRIPPVASTVACLLSLVACFSVPAQAQNRLPEVIAGSSTRSPLSNTVMPKAKAATDLGPAPADRQLTTLSLRFDMTSAQSAALDQLLANQQNPSSPKYHQWLSPEQFAAEFGLSSADISTVSSWLQAQGFTVTNVARSRTFIEFSGTVGQVNQAFGVTLHNVVAEGKQHITNLTDPVLPAALANVVRGMTGLNDFRMRPRLFARRIGAKPQLNGGTSSTGNAYGNLVAPGDFYTIYDLKPLFNAATPINGSGVSVAIAGQVAFNSSDDLAFRTAAGLSTTNLPTTINYGAVPAAPSAIACNGNDPPDSCGDYYETSIDLEWSGATAPSANIIFATGEDVFANALTGAIDNNIAPVVSISYGDCEAFLGTSFLSQYNALLQQANAQGQTVVGPAGDQGATDCDPSISNSDEIFATQGLAVDFPASSPYVTAVGGTMFDENGGDYWSTTDGANGGTALSYIPEQPWNEFFITYGGNIYGLEDGAGGGGFSSVFSKPAWQTGTGVPNDGARDVPDIAFDAAVYHDGYVVCTLGSCTNGFADSAGDYAVFGGTSIPTPSFGGILADLEQKVGQKLGNVNPTIYGLAGSTYASSVFHAKSAGGTNAAPCQTGAGAVDCTPGYPNYFAPDTIACPASSCTGDIAYSAIGYLAASGNTYDRAMGWGSMDVANMVNDWSLATPTGTGTTSALNPSATTATTTTANITAGTSVTISVTVASAPGSTVTTTPTGTVLLTADGASTGVTGTLSGGTATLTDSSTASLAPGPHTFSVSYSGDSIYAGSIGAVQVNVSSALQGDFSIVANPASVTVASGGVAAPITLTVTSLNGFSGAVSFTIPDTGFSSSAFDDDSIETLSVSSVTVASSTPGTATLTVYAYYNPSTGLARKGGAHSAKLPRAPNPWILGGSGVALAGLMWLGLPRRRNRRAGLLMALLTIGIISAAGCSSGSGGVSSTAGNYNAPAGTSTFVVTASGVNLAGTAVSHNATITVTVQ
jgi:subtilase family serine protease